MRRTISYPWLGYTAVVLLLTGCESKDPGYESPTVKPADPSAIGGGDGQASNSYPDPADKPVAPAGGSEMHRTYSGLQYQVIRPGTGARPSSFNRVKVHYHGTLPNGTVFDSSRQRGQPAVFGLNQVIAGWTEGIPLMQEGAIYRFVIPPHLAYGAAGSPPRIGPNQTLIFEVELLEVVY